MRSNRQRICTEGCLSTPIKRGTGNYGRAIAKRNVSSWNRTASAGYGRGEHNRVAVLRWIEVRSHVGGGVAEEPNVQNGMQFDSIRSHASLSVNKIKETDAGDLHRDGHGLEESVGRKASIKLLPRISNTGRKRTASRHTTGTGYFRHHRIAVLVLHDDVIIDVVFELKQGLGCPNHINRILCRSKPGIVRRRRGRRQAPEIRDRCRDSVV